MKCLREAPSSLPWGHIHFPPELWQAELCLAPGALTLGGVIGRLAPPQDRRSEVGFLGSACLQLLSALLRRRFYLWVGRLWLPTQDSSP